MSGQNEISFRKADHIRINLEENVQSSITTGLEGYRFNHRALPEVDLDDVDLKQQLFGKILKVPILISSMTGGTEEASIINQRLAKAAQISGAAMGVGSQRSAIENPHLNSTFQVRQFAPDILLFANVGAIQLNYGYTMDHLQRAVDMLAADGLILHLNALQEALQPEGDTRFKGLLIKIEAICSHLKVPVIVKEVGWGFSAQDARDLNNAGVSAIDVAGAGGTSWSEVERFRIQDKHKANVAAAFRNWGIPTAESILQVRKEMPDRMIIASGGLRNGIDIAKCLALGASFAGIAGPFLKAANQSCDEVIGVMSEIVDEIRICMFLNGVTSIQDLQKVKLEKIK